MSTKRILVIESDEQFASTVASIFSKFDTELKLIADGKEGLDAAKDFGPDLILLCVELPKMSGYSICNKLKKDKNLKSIPLVIMSSEATEDTFEQHKKLKTRAEDYVIKPFTADQLLPKLSPLIQLDAKAGAEEDAEIITLDDDDEAITIDGDDAIAIDEVDALGEVADEPVEFGAEDSTMVMESPLAGGDASLEKFDEVFDGLKMEDSQAPTAGKQSGEEPAITDEDAELASIDDVLGSLDETAPAEGTAEAPADDSGLDLDALADLEMPSEPEVPTETGKAAAKFEPTTAETERAEPEAADLDLQMEPDLGAPGGTKHEAAPEPEIDLKLMPDLDAGAPPETASPPPAAAPKAEPPKPQPPKPAAEAKPPSPATAPVEISKPQAPPAAAVPDPVLMTRLQNTEEENKILREKATKLQSQIEELHQTFEKRESEMGSLRTRTTSKDKEFLALKATINAKDREILDLKEEINKKDQEVLDVQEQVGVKEEEIARIQEAMAKRDREIKDLSNRADSLLREKNDLQEQHQALMKDWDERYSRDTADLEHRIQVAEEEHNKALAEASQQVDQAKDETARLRSELEDTKQRHGDEVFGLRTRYRNEIDKLQQEMNTTRQQLDQTKQRLEQEIAAHEATQQEASRIPQLQGDLERARGTVAALEQQVAELKKDVAAHEDRVVKAYQKIKGDEKIKEKARKAVEIALTLLTDQVTQEERPEGTSASDEAHT